MCGPSKNGYAEDEENLEAEDGANTEIIWGVVRSEDICTFQVMGAPEALMSDGTRATMHLWNQNACKGGTETEQLGCIVQFSHPIESFPRRSLIRG